ncbi:MAG TPA: hypothetical protein VK280_09015 [Streptosporangiaceae bacterium]|nr:hypothetical protein [Streptosporangiaceae bacterium]
MKDLRPGLPDGCGFWLGTAAFFAALGAIGITIAVTEYHPPWPSAWFIAGSVLCALGCVAATWALVLYLAHKEAGRRWCPNPSTHAPRAGQRVPATRPRETAAARAGAILKAADAIGRGELARWLRPVLREINGDLRQAAVGIEQACRDRSYWDVRHEFDLGQTWEGNRRRLAALEGCGDLYDTLRDAYAGIARMRRMAAGSPGLAEDKDLAGVLEAVRKAQAAVGNELAELG